ncbi:hypothetical protein [Virgibacillus necropolis]|uniref:Uncharacterized protein n=1 Tax=Virgibacillus necropolis TaxID=163877 RepID=A0A221MHC6_9BACI|nr:hypothetical protein [Virgibacillus necropolis]ASN07068.1 hypothetical protein CFK40_19635 [Virgibacillus necropolis]
MTAAFPFPEEMMHVFRRLNGIYGIAQVPTESEWMGIYNNAGFNLIKTVLENSVTKALNTQTLQRDSDGSLEFDPSDSIDSSIYEIWDEHQLLTEKYAKLVN